jgi:hypothetical protein
VHLRLRLAAKSKPWWRAKFWFSAATSVGDTCAKSRQLWAMRHDRRLRERLQPTDRHEAGKRRVHGPQRQLSQTVQQANFICPTDKGRKLDF